MNHAVSEVDIGRLSPVQKMELADILYDIAQQEMEGGASLLTPEQLAEIDRRISAADAGETASEPWDIAYGRLSQVV